MSEEELNSYRLTSLEEPSDEMLERIMLTRLPMRDDAERMPTAGSLMSCANGLTRNDKDYKCHNEDRSSARRRA